MEIRIGVQNVAREVVLDSEQTPEQVEELVREALTNGTPLILIDARGQRVIVPSTVLGYVNVGAEQKGRVGFGG